MQWHHRSRQAEQCRITEQNIADFKRREELSRNHLEHVLAAIHQPSGMQRTPEEVAEIKARMDRLQRQRDPEEAPGPAQLPAVDLDEEASSA
jgi:hypothetical protein